jgi:hypothetical protein
MRVALWATLLQGRPTPAQIRTEFYDEQLVHFTIWAMQLDHFPRPEEIIAVFHISRQQAWRWRTWLASLLAKRSAPVWEDVQELRA